MGLGLSRVGLGGYELEDNNVERAVAVLKASLDAGVSWIDTSEGYFDGGNETIIGEALHRVGPMQVATKVTPNGSGFRPEQVHAACRASLQRLGLDHIDLYLLHYPDWFHSVPIVDTWGAMAALADAGLVTHIGMSNYPVEEVLACHEQRPVDAIQDGLSLIDHLHNREQFATAAAAGIEGIVYEPLANGLLTGAIDESTDHDSLLGGHLREFLVYPRLFAPGRIERSLAVARGTAAVAHELGVTPAQLAIAWCVHQSGVTAALAGTTSPVHATQNAESATVELGPDHLAALEKLIPTGPTFED